MLWESWIYLEIPRFLCDQTPFSWWGEQAFVKAKFFHTTQPSHKLSNKFLGPFEILAKARTHSFTLRLPDTFQGVHPIFHVSMLEPAFPNEILNHVQSLPLPVDIEGKLEYEISQIVDVKTSND